jgi:hypothetical protein
VQAVPLTLLLIEHFFCGDRAEIGRNRPLSVHDAKGAISLVSCARKLSIQINVKLVVSEEVFAQHADRVVLCHDVVARFGLSGSAEADAYVAFEHVREAVLASVAQ